MFWVGDWVETVEADKNPFSGEVKMFETSFYSPHLSPISVPKEYKKRALEACNLTNEGFQLKSQDDLWPFDEVLDK